MLTRRDSVDALETLARFSSKLAADQVSPAVRDKARLCLLDGLAAPLSSVEDGRADSIAGALGLSSGAFGSPVIGTKWRGSAGDAAFVNAALSAAAISNDTHLGSASHPGMVIVPVVVALAAERDISGISVLSAIIAGYEVMVRFGQTLVTKELCRTFRPTGLSGPIGAAAAAARLLNLDPRQFQNAIALACNAVGGFNEWARAGTEEHIFHAAAAARNGITAARLAASGVVAAATTLDGDAGLLAAFNARAKTDVLTAGLGEEFRILDILHKAVPACVFVQSPCHLALQIAHRADYAASDVDRVEILVAPQAAQFPGCDNIGPAFSPAAAQQSLQFSVAAVLQNSSIHSSFWSTPETANADRITSRCVVLTDDQASSNNASSARLIVHRGNGDPVELSTSTFPAMTAADVEARFKRNSDAVLGEEKTADILRRVSSLERLESSRQLMSALG